MTETLPTPANFRSVLGRLPTGVVIVTGGDPDRPTGLVMGAFMSVSLDPPLVALCPAKTSTSWPSIQEGGRFCANVLRHDQADLARAFSKSGGDKFAGVRWRPAPLTGAPLLEGVAAWIDCSIYETTEAGDHWMVLGEVRHLAIDGPTGALVFHAGELKPLR